MILDHKKLGFPVYVYVNIELHNLSEEDEKKFHGYLMETVFVGHIAKVTGRYDYMIAIVARDMTHFDEIFREIRRNFSSIIKDYTTATIVQEYKYDSFAGLVALDEK